jgi:hypothetical protein
MRLMVVMVGLVIFCGTAAAQSTPVKMGLWDMTTHSEAAASPAMAEVLKKNGVSLPPPVNERIHTCRFESEWRKSEAAVKIAPQGCIFTHQSENAQGLSTGLRCEADRMVTTIEAKLSWENGKTMHMTMRSVSRYPDVAGEAVISTETTGHFLSAVCGKVAPGTHVPVK